MKKYFKDYDLFSKVISQMWELDSHFKNIDYSDKLNSMTLNDFKIYLIEEIEKKYDEIDEVGKIISEITEKFEYSNVGYDEQHGLLELINHEHHVKKQFTAEIIANHTNEPFDNYYIEPIIYFENFNYDNFIESVRNKLKKDKAI